MIASHVATQARRPGTASLPNALRPPFASGEHQVVLACLREVFGRSDAAPLILPDDETFWERVVALASAEGVAPVTYAGVRSRGWPVPPSLLARWRAFRLGAIVRWETRVAPALRQTLAALGSVGIEAIALKGAALAYLAYPEPSHRTCADVDLLLHPADLTRASAVLGELGYTSRPAEPEPRHHLRARYPADGSVGIELHRHILEEPGPYTLPAADLWERSRAAHLADTAARVLAASDALLHVCLHLAHAHRYRWFVLRGIADVLAITTAGAAPVDWDQFVATTRAARASGAAYWPLWLSRRWLNAPIPDEVLTSLAPSRWLRQIVALVIDSPGLLDRRVSARSDVLDELLLDLALVSGCAWRSQLGVLLQALFPPPDRLGHLPPSVTRSRLRYGAHLLRPTRLARGLISLGRLARRARTVETD